MEIILFLIAGFATTIGSIGGMSGGLIIKPALDAISGFDVATISFMSGCTVLAMSSVNAYRGRKLGIDINMSITFPLAIGACLGGITGKSIFSFISGDRALMQSCLLFVIYLGIYVYAKLKKNITPLYIENKYACFLIGLILGIFSSFLGIGGGPMNMALLFYFIGSTAKVAAKQSLFLILLSQIGSFGTTLITGLPTGVNYIALTLMIIGGVTGAFLGSTVSKKLNDTQVDLFFVDTLVGVMMLNVFNIGRMIV